MTNTEDMLYKPKEDSDQGFPDSRTGKTNGRLATRSAPPQQQQQYALPILGISLCFVLWASMFIYNSSFLGIDGRRYFCLIDDAMISIRYAWNLSHGAGLVWNPGVEGLYQPAYDPLDVCAHPGAAQGRGRADHTDP